MTEPGTSREWEQRVARRRVVLRDLTEAEFQQWLRLAGELYEQALRSDFSPTLLKSFGGVLQLAGNDKERLGGDLTLARIRRAWAGHRAFIEADARNGPRSTAIVRHFLHKTGRHPPNLYQLQLSLQRGTTGAYTAPEWKQGVIEFRRRIQRTDVMTGSAAASVGATFYYLIVDKATWDEALTVGELLEQAAGTVATGAAGVKATLAKRRGLAESGTERSRGTSSRVGGRPTGVERGTLDPPRKPQVSRKTSPKPVAAPPPSSAPPPPPTRVTRMAERAPQRPASHRLQKAIPDLERRGVDVNDPHTRHKLEEIFARYDNPLARLKDARAGIGELRILIMKARTPGVVVARFLPASNRKGSRTPDIELDYGKGRKDFVEVRTLTQASGWKTITDPTRFQKAPISAWVSTDVRRKIDRGQISANRPGTLVIHAPFQKANDVSLEGWRALIQELLAKKPFPPGLRSLEISTPARSHIFEPPGWKGRTVETP